MTAKSFIPALLVGTLLPMTAAADTLGWRMGVNAWAQAYDGDVESSGAAINLEDDLGYDDETGYSGYIQLEHPIPVLPNIMAAYTKVDADAQGFVDGVEFDGVIYTGDVRSSLDITHADLTLYYEVLDNWVNLDLGLTGRYFPEGVEITDVSTDITGSLDLDYVIPMLYGEVRFDLPLTGLTLGLSGNGISYDDDTLYDLKATLGYTFAFGLGVEAGYRAFDLDYEDGEELADVTIDGVFAGLFWDF